MMKECGGGGGEAHTSKSKEQISLTGNMNGGEPEETDVAEFQSSSPRYAWLAGSREGGRRRWGREEVEEEGGKEVAPEVAKCRKKVEEGMDEGRGGRRGEGGAERVVPWRG